MKKLYHKADLPYITAVVVLGCLNHFIYEWTGESPISALFCPVNESVWEHLKLLFFPYLFVITFVYFYEDFPLPLFLFPAARRAARNERHNRGLLYVHGNCRTKLCGARHPYLCLCCPRLLPRGPFILPVPFLQRRQLSRICRLDLCRHLFLFLYVPAA